MSADILLLVNETSPVVERIPSGKQSYCWREREGLRRGRKGERERERERGGSGGVHYLDDRRLSTTGLQDIIIVIDCRTALMSHSHASTVSMVGALHQTINISAREYKKLFDTI
jgi:hypothetical protein